MSDSLRPHGIVQWNSPGQNTGSLSLLQGIFPTQGSNPGLLHWRQILYHLSHQGSKHITLLVSHFLFKKPSEKVFILHWNIFFCSVFINGAWPLYLSSLVYHEILTSVWNWYLPQLRTAHTVAAIIVKYRVNKIGFITFYAWLWLVFHCLYLSPRLSYLFVKYLHFLQLLSCWVVLSSFGYSLLSVLQFT